MKESGIMGATRLTGVVSGGFYLFPAGSLLSNLDQYCLVSSRENESGGGSAFFWVKHATQFWEDLTANNTKIVSDLTCGSRAERAGEAGRTWTWVGL